MATLEIKSISKRYQNETVLDDISLRVGDGETVVLFGPSGAGKTVLLRLVAGVVDPDRGQLLIDGVDVTQSEAEERGIGMAFQNFALFPHMSAFENIASPLHARRQSKEQIDTAVHDVATLLKIDHVLDHAPRALSNGQKQRTSLARALVASPPILLLDDPLRNVDAKLRFEMRLEIPRLLADRGATVIYVTQDYKEAMALGSRIVVLEAGAIRQIGTPADIYLAPATVDIARLFGDPTINLIDVRAQRDATGGYVNLGNVPLRLPSRLDAAIDRDCVLGVRPEDFRFVEPTTEAAFPVEIDAQTPLNEKIVTLVHTRGGQELLISRPAGTQAPDKGEAFVSADVDRIILFDRASGVRVGAEESLATGADA